MNYMNVSIPFIIKLQNKLASKPVKALVYYYYIVAISLVSLQRTDRVIPCATQQGARSGDEGGAKHLNQHY